MHNLFKGGILGTFPAVTGSPVIAIAGSAETAGVDKIPQGLKIFLKNFVFPVTKTSPNLFY